MSISIAVQRNNSPSIYVDKDISTIATYTGSIKDETDISDPIFILEADLADLTRVNYCTIAAFNRSYFINNITSIRAGLVELDCHVDVISSFKAQIRANKAILLKQEKDWNLYINDGSLMTYQNPLISTIDFPSGFSSPEFILAVAGGVGNDGENEKED